MITNIDNAMSRIIGNDAVDGNRTMAIEFEFYAHHSKVEEIRTRLSRAVMLRGMGWGEANGRAFPLWVFKTDGSLDGVPRFNSWRGFSGYEITSPNNLTFSQLVPQMQAVLHILNDCGCKVSKKCGTHVHHVGTRITAKRLQNIVNFAVANEEVIDCIVAKSRRGRNDCFYSKSNRDVAELCHYVTQTRKTTFMRSKGIENTQDVRVSQDTHYRYRNVNVTAFAKHGTIEYRQHQGTLDFSKAVFWLAFTQAQVMRGMSSVKRVRNYQQPVQNTLKQLKWATDDEDGNLIPCSKGHEYLIKYMIGRMAHFGFADKAPRLSTLTAS